MADNINDNGIENETQEKRPRGRPPSSEASRFIAFRVGTGTGKKIEYLEKVTHSSKTDVIINAIDGSHNRILLEDALNNKLVPIIKEIFPKATIEACYPRTKSRFELDESDIKISTDEIVVFFNLNMISEKEERRLRKFVDIDFNILILDSKIEGSRTVKVEVVKQLTGERASKIPDNLLKIIFDSASKNSINIETKNYGRVFSETRYKIETIVSQEPEWATRFRKKLRSMENAWKEVYQKISVEYHSCAQEKGEPDVRT